MAGVDDFNQSIIKEFRANGGELGGGFEGASILLLHHTGARSGTERVNPVAYREVGDDLAVFASKAGAPTNPDWYHNLLAHPETTVEIGTQTVPVVAREAKGAERTTIWEAQKKENPGFAEYEQKTTRQIPVVILERRT
ncbi:MAG TPA: nitroreductase family deazaflavin-dependent oxidoreductase [Acidimicrobiales bacterium]|nr:nitroreductase family deazaflavin-dependent oxidoreductase [Acidimicrobiales bacterium]